MYETFFGLREPAFSLTPDPRFLWPSETHEEGFAALDYGITRRKGFLLLTGEVGAGKTTLLRAVLEQIPTEIEIALVMNTAELDGIDLFKLIAAELRLEEPFESKADYLIALNRFLLSRLDRGLNTVLIIDEAQNLDGRLLEQVRLLSNLETSTEKLLQIVLTGQPELRDLLSTPEISPLRQRIALEHHVQPLRAARDRRVPEAPHRGGRGQGRRRVRARLRRDLLRVLRGLPAPREPARRPHPARRVLAPGEARAPPTCSSARRRRCRTSRRAIPSAASAEAARSENSQSRLPAWATPISWRARRLRLLPGAAGARRALRRPLLHRRAHHRHLLPARLPGAAAAPRERAPSPRARPPPQEAGFRPCLRCRPEAAPGHAGLARHVRRSSTRALRLIEAGALDDAGRRTRSPRGSASATPPAPAVRCTPRRVAARGRAHAARARSRSS